MRLPQIIIIALYSMNLGINLVKNGEQRTGNYSFFTALIAVAINIALLRWGGFFG